VDAKGQRGILFVDVDDRNYRRKRADRKGEIHVEIPGNNNTIAMH
jgi:hypothetical protein